MYKNINKLISVATHDTDLLKKLACIVYLMSEGVIIETAQSEALHNNSDAFQCIKNSSRDMSKIIGQILLA